MCKKLLDGGAPGELGEKFCQFKKTIPKCFGGFSDFVFYLSRCRGIHERSTGLYNARSAFLHLEFGEGSDDFMTQYPAVTQCFTLSLGQVLGIAAFACFAKFFNLAFLIMIAQLIKRSIWIFQPILFFHFAGGRWHPQRLG